MWGHYANKHNGFCLEYDVSLFSSELQLVMPVVYTQKPFDASMILDMRGIDDKYANLCPSLFKSMDWSYEKEWRLVLPNMEYKTAPCKSAKGSKARKEDSMLNLFGSGMLYYAAKKK